MSKDLGILYLSSACPDSDSGSVVARHSLSKNTGLLFLFSQSEKTCGRSQGHEDTVVSAEPHERGK